MKRRLGLAALLAGAVVTVAMSFWMLGERTEATGGITLANPDTGLVSMTSMALDPSDNPVVAYRHGELISEFETSWTVNVLHCDDPTCISDNSLAAPVPDAAGYVLSRDSLTVDSSGSPILAYADNTGIITGQLKLLHCGNPDCTLGNTIAAPDPGSEAGGISVALDASGRPVISYIDLADLFQPDLRLLRCGNASCTANNVTTTVAEISWAIGAAVMTLDGSDYPVIAYLTPTRPAAGVPAGLPSTGGPTAFDLRIVRCGNEFCSSANTTTTVATGISGETPTLALDSSSRPVVAFAYTQYTGTVPGLEVLKRELQLVRCGTPDCSSDNTVASLMSLAPDTRLGVGMLRLDASDRPVVVFSQINCGDSPCTSDVTSELQVLHCGDTTCLSGNVTTTVASAPSAERFWPALVLDSLDRPVISYSVAGENGGLFVLRCGSADCSAGAPKTTPPPTNTPLATASPSPVLPTATPPTNTPIAPPTATAVPPATNTPTPPASSSATGDVSCDGTVNPLDAALILQFNIGLIDALPCAGSGDVNGDGMTNAIDSLFVLQFAAGLIPNLG